MFHVWPAGTTKSSAVKVSKGSFTVSKSCDVTPPGVGAGLLIWSYSTTFGWRGNGGLRTTTAPGTEVLVLDVVSRCDAPVCEMFGNGLLASAAGAPACGTYVFAGALGLI